MVNPWLSNGRNDFRSLDRIVARAIEPGMTDAEKARALWWQEVQHRFHFEGDNGELLDPVKVFNVYGYNTCGNDSICLAGLWRTAGLKVAPARLVGHCVTQVFYDGSWHLMDGDMHAIYLLRDNQTVAGEQDLVRDHDLIRRTHTQGILQPDRRAGDEWESSIYVFEGKVTGDRNSANSALNMTLRPGEAIEWRWGHLDPIKYHGTRPPRFPDRVCNGSWEYRPDFQRPAWRAGATTVEAIRERDGELMAEEGKTGIVVWTMSSPYVFVGGRLEVEGTGAGSGSPGMASRGTTSIATSTGSFRPKGPARYRYLLKCELSGDARLRRLGIANDLQMAPLTLPGMGVGANAFTYTDETAGATPGADHPPVGRAVREPAARTADRTGLSSTRRSHRRDGDRLPMAARPRSRRRRDRRLPLRALRRADMKWPLSMSFAKLISRTADAGQARYTLPGPRPPESRHEVFLARPARDGKGVWGAWSPTWSFTPRGPAPPREVRLEFDRERNRGVLRWAAEPAGPQARGVPCPCQRREGLLRQRPALHGHGGSLRKMPSEFPANFVVETAATELEVVGPGVKLPGANKAFYRVVAVDAAGNRSGPSDYAAAPRPVIVSAPVTDGQERRGTIAIRSRPSARWAISGPGSSTARKR